MNRKYLIYSALTLMLMVFQPSWAMGGSFFKFARLVGVGALPFHSLYKATRDEPLEERPLSEVLYSQEVKALDEWSSNIKNELNIPNAESISLIVGRPWLSKSKKKSALISLSTDQAICLSNALVNKKNALTLKEQKESGDADKIIARDSHIFKHELGHIVHKDTQKNRYVPISIAFGVETFFLGVTSSLKKLCKIHPPKKLVGTVLRSGCAVGAVVPKLVINSGLLTLYSRYQEAQADKFACENAASRLELEEFVKDYRKMEHEFLVDKIVEANLENVVAINKNSRTDGAIDIEEEFEICRQYKQEIEQKTLVELRQATDDTSMRIFHFADDWQHPYFPDRAAMGQRYLDRWDAEHGSDKSCLEATSCQ